MFRHVLGVAFFITLANSQGNKWKEHMMEMNETFPEDVIIQFNRTIESHQIDSNGDRMINNFEATQFFFLGADVREGRISQADFMDSYRRRFPFIPSEILAIMFNLLDDLNHDPGVAVPVNFTPTCNPKLTAFSNIGDFGDGVLTSNDISLQDFASSDMPTLDNFHKALNDWVKEAAEKVHKFKTMPFKVNKGYEADYDFFDQVDVNRDDMIVTTEFEKELMKFADSGSVTRTAWTNRKVATYGQKPEVANVMFDYMDINDDLLLDASDAKQIIMMADANHDDRTTKQELFRLLNRKENTIRRMLGQPIDRFEYDCPGLTVNDYENDDDPCDDSVDVTLMTMDMDNDFDGNITKQEKKRHIFLMDKNKDEKVDRVEFIQFHHERYKQDMGQASLDFDAYDMNADGVLTLEDMMKNFKNQTDWMCVCEYRLSALASARAAKHLAKERQMKMELTRMKYFNSLKNDLKSVHSSSPYDLGPLAQRRWKTMNGKPAKASCKQCSAKENWGMSDGKEDQKNDDVTGSIEQSILSTLMAAMKKMKLMDYLGPEGDDEKMLHLLMESMRMLQKEDRAHKAEVNDLSSWMAMNLEKVMQENARLREMNEDLHRERRPWPLQREIARPPYMMSWEEERKTKALDWPKRLDWY